MLRKLLLLCLLLITGFHRSEAQVQLGGVSGIANYASPKEFVIGGVVVTGTKYLDESVLISIANLPVGDSIQVPGERIAKAIQNLWKQGLFSDIKILATRTQGQLVFLELQLQERPRLSKFSFKGVSKSEADKIREEIKLERDRVITDNVLATTRNKVKDYFVDKGYLNVDVGIREIRDSAYINREILDIVVQKGKKVCIGSIRFEGNRSLTDAKLKKTMKDTKERTWYKIFTSGKYLEEKYADDKNKLVAKYNALGFRDAAIVKDSVWRPDAESVNILIRIDEGRKYYFRNINWIGNTKHTSTELAAVLGIRKGDVYNQDILDERLYMNQSGRDVSSLYMDDGYLFFSVTPVEVNVEGDSIDMEMRLYEGKQARINKITVTGNTKTNDRVIMREIRTKPGQLFSRSDIIRTQRELAQLGYFDQEKLGVNPKPNPADGTVDIEYTVEEKPSDQLELSGGYGANQLVGTLGLSFNNFSARNMFNGNAWSPLPSGDGQRLSLRAQSNGKYFQSYNASFTEPWLGGKKPNALSVSVYQSIQTNGRPKGDILRSQITITGASVGLSKRLKRPDDFFILYQEVNFQFYQLNNYTGSFVYSTGTSRNLSFTEMLSRNSVDAPIYPRSGSNNAVSLEFTPPWSKFGFRKNIDYYTAPSSIKYAWIEYYKIKFSSDWYNKVAGNLVFHTRVLFGFLNYYNPAIGASPFERYYLGGDGLSGFSLDGREIIALRGYDNNSLTPRDNVGRQVGGTIYDKFTFELRYPLSLNPSATIFAVSFLEAGNSWLGYQRFNPFMVHRAGGAGIRIFLPVFGLLGLDWAYGFDPIPNIPGAAGPHFHFMLGQQF
ncbi:MAG: outer membrane protein assembly factor BamA [Bacteroidota bacterium]